MDTEPVLGELIAGGKEPAPSSLSDLQRSDPNPYQRAPLQVTIYDCVQKRPLRSYYFLGKIPSDILAAARRGTVSSAAGKEPAAHWPPTKWSTKDAAKLASYYGPRWRDLLTPDCSLVLETGGEESAETTGGEESAETTGGEESAETAEPDFGDLRNLNILDEDEAVVITEDDFADAVRMLKKTGTDLFRDETETSATADVSASVGTSNTVYSDIGVFPEDKIADIREKIYLVAGIPPYAQHLFWETEDSSFDKFSGPPGDAGNLRTNLSETGVSGGRKRVRTSYDMFVTGLPYNVDIRRFGENETLHLADIPVDRELSVQVERGEVFIEALDSFRLMVSSKTGTSIRRLFVADLAQTIESRKRELLAASQDSVRSELLFNGFVLKYWPMLTQNAMRLYFESPAKVMEEYPRLIYPRSGTVLSRKALANMYSLQQEILGQAYARQETVAHRYGSSGRALAVTSATVSVPPLTIFSNPVRPESNTRINVRNVFDLFATSTKWPAATARFYLSATGRGRQDITAIKYHLSAAPGGNDDGPEIMKIVSRTIRRSSMTIIIRADQPVAQQQATQQQADQGLVGDRWLRGRPRLVTFVLLEDGSYTLDSTWPEDQRYSPSEIVKKLDKLVRPLVETINAMGDLAFPMGGHLQMPSEDRATTVKNMTVSAFWPRALNEEAFRLLKSRWRRYEEAGMVAVRGLHQAGAFAFRYEKGIVDYDPRTIERTIVVSTITDPVSGQKQTVRETAERTQNTYRYLTEPTVAQRWDCLYGGRTVRYFHRTTDIKVEMIGVSVSEMRNVWLTVFTFFDSLVSGPTKIPGILEPGGGTVGTRRGLKALQDSDPDLFDLRKYDSNATVYSVLCQNPRPPAAYTPQEAAQLPAKKRQKLVEYWNFTLNQPAYYECSHPRYPHLSFLEGRHAKGYCLPCCQKTTAFPESRRDRINQQCAALAQQMKQSKSAEADASDTDADQIFSELDVSSRHILSYGKRIAPGRTATLSRKLESGLLFDTGVGAQTGYEYRLFGVDQSLPAIPQAAGGGYYFAVCQILGHSPHEVGTAFVWTAANMGESYSALCGGRVGEVFATEKSLAEAMRATFVETEQSSLFTPFSPGGPAHSFWKSLVEELTYICYGVLLILFTDPDGGSDRITAEAAPRVVQQMRTHEEGLQFGVIFDIGQPEGKRGAGGIYPLVIHRAGRRGEASQSFSIFSSEPENVGEQLVGVLREMVLATAPAPPRWDLNSLAKYLKGPGRQYTPAAKLINGRDHCYAVVLNSSSSSEGTKTKETVYAAITSSPHSRFDALSSGQFRAEIGVRYGPWGDDCIGGAAALGQFLQPLVAKKPVIAVPAHYLTNGGLYVGVAIRFLPEVAPKSWPEEVLYFYHSPAESPVSLGKSYAPEGDLVDLPVMPNIIDRAIWDRKVHSPWPLGQKTAEAQGEAYLSSLRLLMLSQLAAHIFGHKETAVRDALIKAFAANVSPSPDKTTDRRPGRIMAEFKDILDRDAYKTHPTDLDKLQLILAQSLKRARSGKTPLERFTSILKESTFEFDLVRLRKIQDNPVFESAAKDLRAIFDGLTLRMPYSQILEEGRAVAPSMYSGCLKSEPQLGDLLRAPCEKEKLVVPEERYSAFVEIIASDLRSPYHRNTLILHTSGVSDDLDFIRRPGEKLEIRI